MSHDHHAHHHGSSRSFGRAFAIGVGLNTGYIIIEVVFGLWVGSLALLADAGHNLSDVFSLLLAWGAAYMSQRPPSTQRTYGLRRASILAALANAVILLIAIGVIAWEAIGRFAHPHSVPGATVMGVAGVGTIINTATALLFMKGREHDLNIKGAFLHMAADAGVSLSVVVAGLCMQITAMQWIDPAMSLVIVIVIAVGTWGLLRDSVNLSLDAVPKHIDPTAVRHYLHHLPGVHEVHDLHIWPLSTTESALTVHLIIPGHQVDDAWLTRVSHELHERFSIEHPTIQIERGDGADQCRLAPDEVV